MATHAPDIRHFLAPGTDNFQYLLTAGAEAMIVDPLDAEAIRAQLEADGVTAAGILITHTHWDHIHGLTALGTQHELPVYVHRDGQGDLPEGVAIEPVVDGDRIPFGGESIEVWETPGHHGAHVTYAWRDILLVGDVLFLAGCGNPNFGGDPDLLFDSVFGHLRGVDPAYRLAWGHDYAAKNLSFAAEVEPDNEAVDDLWNRLARDPASATLRTLAEELTINPFFRCDRPALLETARSEDPECPDDPRAVFKVLRRMRDRY